METSLNFDLSQRFLFEKRHIRGELIRLKTVIADMMLNHEYNAIEKKLLGELVCVANLLSSLLKVKGKFTLQLQSSEALSLLLVQVNHNQDVRALLQAEKSLDSDDLMTIARGGTLLVSLHTETMKEPYQTIIPLHSSTIAANIEDYFERSEQLRTRVWLKTDGDVFAGLLLQALPEMKDEDYWAEAEAFCETVSDEEMLNLPFNELLFRLFHEQDDVLVFDPKPRQFNCGCSREKMFDAVCMMPDEELEAIFEEEGHIVLRCDFCHEFYAFTKEQVQQGEDSGEDQKFDETLH